MFFIWNKYNFTDAQNTDKNTAERRLKPGQFIVTEAVCSRLSPASLSKREDCEFSTVSVGPSPPFLVHIRTNSSMLLPSSLFSLSFLWMQVMLLLMLSSSTSRRFSSENINMGYVSADVETACGAERVDQSCEF